MTARICITTAYDESYRTLGEICAASIARYAQTFGYEYRIFVNRPLVRDHSFDKWLIIQELFAEGYEFVFWIDSDAIFARFDRDISAEIIPDKHFYLTSYTLTLAAMPGVLTTIDMPMAGFLFLRNAPWSHQLIKTIWENTKYANTPIRDNAALFEILGYHYSLDLALHPDKVTSAQINRPNYDLWKSIQRLDTGWHGMRGIPPIHEVVDPVVIHYPAQPLAQRILSMQQDYARNVSKTPPQLITTLDYDFSQPIDGDGWYIPEYSKIANCWYRWSGRKTATINVPLQPDRDYRCSFWLLQTLSSEVLGEFQMLIDDHPVSLNSTPAIYGSVYSGLIPSVWLNKNRPIARLTFQVPKLQTPGEFFESHDTRLLGAAIAALHIEACSPHEA